MFELGPEKLLMLLLICLVIFGGKRIPEIGGAIGKGIREFKRGVSDMGNAINEPAPAQPHAESVEQTAIERREEPKRLG
ncbi:MAG TPA: twin-arginine translocase TatA/TatE family subunit [Gemmatimonadaceae bacterium]|nr:twin-arginine translocase TatA/TatE family subunit [Gemmatimonadaceae bacterium]